MWQSGHGLTIDLAAWAQTLWNSSLNQRQFTHKVWPGLKLHYLSNCMVYIQHNVIHKIRRIHPVGNLIFLVQKLNIQIFQSGPKRWTNWPTSIPIPRATQLVRLKLALLEAQHHLKLPLTWRIALTWIDERYLHTTKTDFLCRIDTSLG